MDMFFSSLYVHVPFCIKKCNYCSFYSLKWNEELEGVYLNAILKEIELTSKLSHLLKTIYIGGGTPSCLSINGLKKLLMSLRKSFKTDKSLEFSIEINPATVDEEKISLMKDYGVNRLSIGVQSFNDRELLFLGRIHSTEDEIKTLQLVFKKGFQNVSIDLIYGIPGQTLKSWHESLKKSLMFNIKHISLYELSVEKNTQLANQLKLGKISLPFEEDIVKMYEFATDFLNKKGFKKYEISNFAKSGFRCRHNIFYWMRKPYLGIGPSAYSFFEGRRLHNPSDLFFYVESLLDNRLPWINDYSVNKAERLKEKIFLGLRMKKGIILKRPCLLEIFKIFEEENFVVLSGSKVRLTDKGMLLSNEIFTRVLLHIESCSVCKQG